MLSVMVFSDDPGAGTQAVALSGDLGINCSDSLLCLFRKPAINQLLNPMSQSPTHENRSVIRWFSMKKLAPFVRKFIYIQYNVIYRIFCNVKRKTHGRYF